MNAYTALALMVVVVAAVAFVVIAALRRSWTLKRAKWEPKLVPQGNGLSEVFVVKEGQQRIHVDTLRDDDPQYEEKLFAAESEAMERASALNSTFKRLKA